MIENLFQNIDFRFLFTVLGLLFGLFALIQAWRYKKRKEIAFMSWDNEALLKKEDIKVEGLKLILNNKEIQQVNVMRLYLQNEGNSVLKEEDFLNKFELQFEDPLEIINFYSTDKYNRISWNKLDNRSIEFTAN